MCEKAKRMTVPSSGHGGEMLFSSIFLHDLHDQLCESIPDSYLLQGFAMAAKCYRWPVKDCESRRFTYKLVLFHSKTFNHGVFPFAKPIKWCFAIATCDSLRCLKGKGSHTPEQRGGCLAASVVAWPNWRWDFGWIFNGTSQFQMDDLWVPPYIRKPPYVTIYWSIYYWLVFGIFCLCFNFSI